MEQRTQQPSQALPAQNDPPRVRPRLVLVTGSGQPAAPAAVADSRAAAAAEQLLQVELPARPSVLVALGAQMQLEEPDFGQISELIKADPGLASAVVKTANSPYVGLGRRVNSVLQALYYLGMGEVFSIVTGVMLRRVFAGDPEAMERLWDESARRAGLMAKLAREMRWVKPDRAHTCGLFENCGMAVLLQHAPGYKEVFAEVTAAPDPQRVERERYGLDHAVIGDALVRSWGLPESIALAVRHHHGIPELMRQSLPEESMVLVALSGLANEALARTRGRSGERWERDVEVLSQVLGETWPSLEERVADAVQGVRV
jgi:HD-like signal output (HDOD) protein